MFKGTTLQHLIGGFIGGLVGIMVFGVFTQNLYVVGSACAVGATLGWLYEHIYCALRDGIAAAKLARREARLHEVTVRERINRLRDAASWVFIIGDFTLVACSVWAFGSMWIPWFAIALWGVCTLVYAIGLFTNDWTEGTFAERNMAYELEQYQRGRVAFFFRKLLEIAWIGSVFTVVALTQFIYYGLVFFVGLLLCEFPLTITRVARKFLYLTVRELEYWVCIATTLSVTLAVAYTFEPTSAEPVRLVSFAFLTGCLCGAISVVVSRGLVLYFEADPERKRLVTVDVVNSVNEDMAPQIIRAMNIGFVISRKQRQKVRRLLPAMPMTRPITTRVIPSLVNKK